LSSRRRIPGEPDPPGRDGLLVWLGGHPCDHGGRHIVANAGFVRRRTPRDPFMPASDVSINRGAAREGKGELSATVVSHVSSGRERSIPSVRFGG